MDSLKRYLTTYINSDNSDKPVRPRSLYWYHKLDINNKNYKINEYATDFHTEDGIISSFLIAHCHISKRSMHE